jgi:hypothetical protein
MAGGSLAFTGESRATTAARIFQDVTASTLGTIESYQRQLLLGVDHWRTVLDGACGIDVYGNHGTPPETRTAMAR